MPTATVNFTTGPALLPDVGVVNYNGCTFSPLFTSEVSGEPLKDEAGRTVKLTKLTISIDGYVTLAAGLTSVSPTIVNMHRLLTAQGGALVYTGRGFDISVNTGPPGNRDLAWGPVPELIEFQPLGGGLSAKVKWKVTAHITGTAAGRGFRFKRRSNNLNVRPVDANINLLQFNFETNVTYGEDGFSGLTMTGTLEIPLTRVPNQASRTLAFTADDVRHVIHGLATAGIDMSRFHFKRRNFNLSRDKRTITWDVAVEEKPYMDLPPNCTIAKGTFTVKPARAGPGLCLWLCTLNATYTVRADRPRRQAYLLFLALLRLRMSQAEQGNIPQITANAQAQGPSILTRLTGGVTGGGLLSLLVQNRDLFLPSRNQRPEDLRRAILIDFHISEGLYLDSKTVTFSATWRMCTTFSHILVASGLWTKVREENDSGGNLWAISMDGINRTTSWLHNDVDRDYAVIVDFGT